MLIREVASNNGDSTKLVALTQFLMGRAQDTDAQKTISTDAFIHLAANMGISLTPDRLNDLVQKPPLSNLIDNVEGDTVIFKGSEMPPSTMTVDQAQATVDSMAKRAAKRDL